jgi:2-desacetyl-2-hydroxyethyl bacteriochlorophyllide A dehydrogenase
MRAAVLHPGAKDLRTEEWPTPAAGPGEVLVRVAACGLCRTDLHYLHGVPTAKAPPLVLGHEVSGTVEGIGTGVEGIAPGTRVLLPPVLPCGTCEPCRRGRGNICAKMLMLGNHRDGGFAEFVAVPASCAFPLPPGLALEESSVLSDAGSTAYHAVVNRGRVAAGEWVAVLGCGGVGLSVLQMAKAAGARLIAVDVAPGKLETARRLGADELVDGFGDVPKALRKITGGGPDAAFEVIGNPKTIRAAVDAVRPGGRAIIVGYSDAEVALPAGRIMFRELEVRGSLGCPLQDFPRVLALAEEGAFDLKAMVTHRYPLEGINEGFDALNRGAPDLVRAITLPRQVT